MTEELSFKERLIELKAWMPEIIETIKKDLRNEHLKKDYAFCKKYFPGKNINKLTSQELADAYTNALVDEEAGEAIGEFIGQRWIFSNSEIYHLFEERLSKINPEFTEIKELTEAQSTDLQNAACSEFGALNTYIFSQLNGVAFSKDHLKKMSEMATRDKKTAQTAKVEELEKRSHEDLKALHEREIARLTDKYEKKLLGFQKKYTQDVEMLKKQIGNLQRKMAKV